MADSTVTPCEIIFVGGAREGYIVDIKHFEDFVFAWDHGDTYFNLTATRQFGKSVTVYINLTHIAAIVRFA